MKVAFLKPNLRLLRIANMQSQSQMAASAWSWHYMHSVSSPVMKLSLQVGALSLQRVAYFCVEQCLSSLMSIETHRT